MGCLCCKAPARQQPDAEPAAPPAAATLVANAEAPADADVPAPAAERWDNSGGALGLLEQDREQATRPTRGLPLQPLESKGPAVGAGGAKMPAPPIRQCL